MNALDLVIIGPLLIDEFQTHDARLGHITAGGSLLYAALAASYSHARVGIVSLCGQDYPSIALQKLRTRGVLMDALNTQLEYSGRCLIRENAEGERQFLYPRAYPSLSAVSPKPENIPNHYYTAPYFLITPFVHVKQLAIIQAIRDNNPNAVIALDPYSLLPKGIRETYLHHLQQIDYFLPSEAEYQCLSRGHKGPEQFLSHLRNLPKEALVIKQGQQGARLYQPQCEIFTPSAKTDSLLDTNGAGDSFCGGFMGALGSGCDLSTALNFACAIASFTVEKNGAEGLYNLDISRMTARLGGLA